MSRQHQNNPVMNKSSCSDEETPWAWTEASSDGKEAKTKLQQRSSAHAGIEETQENHVNLSADSLSSVCLKKTSWGLLSRSIWLCPGSKNVLWIDAVYMLCLTATKTASVLGMHVFEC